MNHRMMTRALSIVVPLVFLTMTCTAFGAEYYLRADAFTKDLPDPSGVGTLAVPIGGVGLD